MRVVAVEAVDGDDERQGRRLEFADKLIAWCRDQLAAHQVPPKGVVVNHLARTPSPRIDKSALPLVDS
jgi:acyl-CoA synthetase (AMP-forming)/AMP-acid ligase II